MNEPKSGKPFRRPAARRKQWFITTAVLMVIVLLGALYSFTMYRNDKQEPSEQSSLQDTGGLTVSDKPSSINISMRDEALRVAEILKQINSSRTANGVAPVSESELLDQSAVAKANDMISRNYWSHNTPDGLEPWTFIRQVGYKYHDAGENLWNGYDSYTVVSDWLNSSTHKAVMLDTRYTEIGIAIQKATSYIGQQNVYVIVTHYASPLTNTTSGYSPSVGTSTSTDSGYNYEISNYSTTPMPSFSRSSPIYQSPAQQQCGNTDSSYYANCTDSNR